MLSVIITVFEQLESLTALLYCLHAQDLDEPFEILICDDGSSAWALEKTVADSRLRSLDIKYIWQPKNGYRAARSKNNALRCAKGDIVVLIDGDILVHPDFLRRHRGAHAHAHQLVCNPRKWILEKAHFSSQCSSSTTKESGAIELILKLASEDITEMLAMADNLSYDIETEGQRALSVSSSPWMACIGFSLSFDPPLGGCFFDETFEGWGPEDREFALRLAKRHGYSVSFLEDVTVYHLESYTTGRPAFSLLPRAHSQIASHLRNMLHFRELYPSEKLDEILAPILAFQLNSSTDRWELKPPTTVVRPTPEIIDAQLTMIRGWLSGC